MHRNPFIERKQYVSTHTEPYLLLSLIYKIHGLGYLITKYTVHLSGYENTRFDCFSLIEKFLQTWKKPVIIIILGRARLENFRPFRNSTSPARHEEL